MPDYGHAVSKAAPGDEEARSVGVHVILNPGRLGARWKLQEVCLAVTRSLPGRLLATTTLLQAKG